MRGIQDTVSNPANEFSSNWQSNATCEQAFTSRAPIFNTNSILAHINGQTEAVSSGVVSIDPIVDSDGGTIIDSPLPSAHLGARP